MRTVARVAAARPLRAPQVRLHAGLVRSCVYVEVIGIMMMNAAARARWVAERRKAKVVANHFWRLDSH